jgi:putative RNA methylase family UPF0020
MRPLSTRIDRYPAKMVSRLATELVARYVDDPDARLLDPFCGSGAILAAAQARAIEAVGLDLNPYATLLSSVKLDGFCARNASMLADELIRRARLDRTRLEVNWEAKEYWFTSATLNKYERLRFQASQLDLPKNREGRAVLLAFALSIRLCSRADQRSPKPFISRSALARKKGRHLDPFRSVRGLIEELGFLYGNRHAQLATVSTADVVRWTNMPKNIGNFSHIVTSPPYLNAQDYFRNFKLELFLLEGILPFKISSLRNMFVGTERGLDDSILADSSAPFRRELAPELQELERNKPRLARVVHRYLADMWDALEGITGCMRTHGKLIIVCGDNLVGGVRIKTWEVINEMIRCKGLKLFDQFGDRIACRAVPPSRLGHKGLIKEEIVSAFEM